MTLNWHSVYADDVAPIAAHGRTGTIESDIMLADLGAACSVALNTVAI